MSSAIRLARICWPTWASIEVACFFFTENYGPGFAPDDSRISLIAKREDSVAGSSRVRQRRMQATTTKIKGGADEQMPLAEAERAKPHQEFRSARGSIRQSRGPMDR